MKQCGFYNRVKATKGYHFIDGPYVEYEDSQNCLSAAEIESLPSLLNIALQTIIQENIPTKVFYLDKSSAEELCGCDLKLYPVNTIRIVEVAGHLCPCGGTHVSVNI